MKLVIQRLTFFNFKLSLTSGHKFFSIKVATIFKYNVFGYLFKISLFYDRLSSSCAIQVDWIETIV